ncbi:MAG: ABC transporter ATP-binding protein [Betaproteobacteria bacterium]|nr:ABC transporter ATP-binding protein [Betaproteobacteria bacterium]
MSDLQLDEVTITRGGLPVCRDIRLHAPRGEVTVLLGPNGAGKTTLLDAISGVIATATGKITLDGRDILGLRREQRARLGLAHVEQGRSIFPGLSVEENILAGARSSDAVHRVMALFPQLIARLHTQAGLLSGGEQQMLVIGRALAGKPSVLLVDEMSLGLAPIVVRNVMPIFRQLAHQGVGILLVEQYAALALEVGDRAYVLNRGEIVFEGDCAELRGKVDVLRGAYLAATPAGHK